MQHPIIVLWFDAALDAQRLKEEFKDTYTTFIEPFSPLSYLYESECYFALKKREINLASEKGPVFILERTDQISHDLLQDEEWLQRMTHSFLVKDRENDVICQKVTSCADLAPVFVAPNELRDCPENAVHSYLRCVGQKLTVKAIATVPTHLLKMLDKDGAEVSDVTGLKINALFPASLEGERIS